MKGWGNLKYVLGGKGLGCIITKHFHGNKPLDKDSRSNRQEPSLNTQVIGHISDSRVDWSDLKGVSSPLK